MRSQATLSALLIACSAAPVLADTIYTVDGDLINEVRIQEDGKAVDMKLGPGDMYLHPAKVPHSPMREAGSLGLVIERKRAGSGMQDGLLWYCDGCNAKLHETYFELRDIEKDFLPRFRAFYGDESKRTCGSCGDVLPTDPRFVDAD